MKKMMAYSLLAAGLIGLCGSGAMAQEKPFKVLILAGQSNMQGHAHVRTFGPMGLDPKTVPILKEMRNADGTPWVCEKVWISSIGCAEDEQVGKLTVGFGAKVRGPKIGPEFTFGIYMQKLLDEPILIIKIAWGGKSRAMQQEASERCEFRRTEEARQAAEILKQRRLLGKVAK